MPLIVLLGLLAAAFEGLGLTLFIPLVQALGEAGGPAAREPGLVRAFWDVVDLVAPDHRLLVIAFAIFAAILLKSVVSYAGMVVFGVAYARVSHALRVEAFRRLMAMPLSRVERDSSGRLLNLLNTETWRATDALGALFNGLSNLCTLVVFVVLLLLLSLRLTLIALCCVALIPPVVHLATRQVKSLGARGLAANQQLSTRSLASVNGLREVHGFGREEFETRRYEKSSREVRDTFLRLSLIAMTSGPITEVLTAGIVVVVALTFHALQVPVPTLVGFLAILYRLQPRALGLANARTQLLSLETAVVEVMALIDDRRDAPQNRHGCRFAELRQAIAFDRVSFTYPGAAERALAEVSFTVARGSTVAIVGASGAGKSTLLDLLLRFSDPQLGEILVDGSSLREIDELSWRSRLAVVSQDPYIFHDTVRANIVYGCPEADDERVVKAARLACADEFIRELPQGYDTVVGEQGSRLSGGEKQRLSLARALVRDPDLLILDEATNALDALTERAFHDTLARCAGERTVVMVAHRMTMMSRTDHIVVLARGRVVEQGSFRTLLRANGAFARLYREGAPDASGALPLELAVHGAV